MNLNELQALFNMKSDIQRASSPATSLSDCIKAALDRRDGANLTIGTIHDGKREWSVFGQNGATLPNELHDYEIGSITKTVTATLIANAVSAKLVRIDDPINRYLDLTKDKPYPTIRQLLTHTSGYKAFYYEWPMIGNVFAGRGIFSGITGEMLLRRAAGLNMTDEPQPFCYSNFGVSLLGLVLEKVYGEKYTVLANRFLQETGMPRSHIFDGTGDLGDYYEWTSNDGYLPAGGIVSDIQDMLTYAQKQLDNQGIFAMTHETLSKVVVTSKNRMLVNMGINEVGMNWAKDTGNNFIWHSGDLGVYHSYIGVCMETNSAVVVLGKLTSFDYLWPLTIGTKILKSYR